MFAGAKLVALKNKLQEQMRLKREEARQRRCEALNLDNEEGFGDEEEEAELTDQTDTDEDVIDDEEEEEEMDDEECTKSEKEDTDANPFIDAEAEDDEEDDAGEIDEADLHLALDTQENDGDDGTVTSLNVEVAAYSDCGPVECLEFRKIFWLSLLAELETDEEADKTRPNFLKSAIQKTTHTLELFDEDANTESPTMSQNSNKDIGMFFYRIPFTSECGFLFQACKTWPLRRIMFPYRDKWAAIWAAEWRGSKENQCIP